MSALLDAALDNKPITEEVIVEELNETCESVHGSCDDSCPVYYYNNGAVPRIDKNHGCSFFKNGDAMLKFIRLRKKEILEEYPSIEDWTEVRHFLKEE